MISWWNVPGRRTALPGAPSIAESGGGAYWPEADSAVVRASSACRHPPTTSPGELAGPLPEPVLPHVTRQLHVVPDREFHPRAAAKGADRLRAQGKFGGDLLHRPAGGREFADLQFPFGQRVVAGTIGAPA